MRVIVLCPGRTRPEKEKPRPVMAPDGAPVSLLRMPQLTWPLIDVALIGNPARRMKIEARAFDPAKYIRVACLPPSQRPSQREMPDLSTEPESELLTWTTAKLKTLPEFLFVHKPADDKTALVKQILKVRRRV